MSKKPAQKLPDYRMVQVSELIPYAQNSRRHSEAQVAKIARSIEEFGFLNPVITDGKKGIVAGHGRVMAAKAIGMEEVPTVDAAHLTAAQKRAYVIADNRLALDASWDDVILTAELEILVDDDFDLTLTGFEDDEIDKLLASGDIEPIETETDESRSATMDYIAIGKNKIPVDPEEFSRLKGALDAYSELNGTTMGFGAYILGKIEE